MLSKTSHAGLAAAAIVLLAGTASADFKSLVTRLPGEANAIVLIDVAAFLNSPIGVREGWKDKMADAYAQKPVTIPPEASRVVMAALLDPLDMGSIWEVSVMDLTKPLSLDLLARAERGYLDKLGTAPAVWSPNNAYFIQLDPLVFGVTCPADRQFTARWVARKPGPSSSLSAYLSGAAGTVSAATPLVMALDLQDVTCAMKVRRRLEAEKFDSLEGKDADFDVLSQTIGGIRGVRLSVALGEQPIGKGVVDFDRDTAGLASFAKPLLLELLSQMGAFIEDFEGWQVTAKGKQVTFEGKLSTDGLRRLLSVIEPPAPAPVDASAPEKTGVSDPDNKAAATKQYYTAARAIIQKLDKQLQGGRTPMSLSTMAMWMKRDATAISRLPILNVDPDLVQFAANVSVRLNDAARLMSQGTLQTQARTSGVKSTYVHSDSFNYEGWGTGYDYRSAHDERLAKSADMRAVRAQRQQVTNEEKAQVVSQAGEIFAGVKQEAELMRIELTKRYQMEF